MKKELLKHPRHIEPMKAELNNANFVVVDPAERPIILPCQRFTISVHTWHDSKEKGLVATPEAAKRLGNAVANLPKLVYALQDVYEQDYDNLSVSSRMRIEKALENVL